MLLVLLLPVLTLSALRHLLLELATVSATLTASASGCTHPVAAATAAVGADGAASAAVVSRQRLLLLLLLCVPDASCCRQMLLPRLLHLLAL